MSSVIKYSPAASITRPGGAAVGRPTWSTLRREPPKPAPPVEAPPAPDPVEAAARIVAEVEDEARATLEIARAMAAEIEEQARADGYAHGAEQAEAEWQERYTALEDRAREIEAERLAWFEAAEPELARLGREIAEKILKQELQVSPEAVIGVVRAAMHRIKDREVRILVNPRDLETVRGHREDFAAIADGAPEIEIVSDRRVGQGGCVLETPSGKVDARLESQLDRIAETLDRACAAGQPDSPDGEGMPGAGDADED